MTKDSIPRWLMGLLVTLALCISAVGTIAITNAATISEYKDAQKTQFRDIKDRLIRIENKLDSSGGLTH